MAIDLLVAVTVIVAALIGFYKGAIQPLLVYIGFLGTALILWRNRRGFTALVDGVLHANAVWSIFIGLIIAVVVGYLFGRLGGLIHKMPVVRGADGFLGVFVNAFVAVMVCYVAISALVVAERAFLPTFDNAALNSAQALSIQKQLASNPFTAGLASSSDMTRLLTQAAKPGGARISETPQLNQVQGLYRDFMQPQLRSSRLAPVVLGFGHHVPGFGRIGPQDVNPPSPTPTPAPTPTKK